MTGLRLTSRGRRLVDALWTFAGLATVLGAACAPTLDRIWS